MKKVAAMCKFTKVFYDARVGLQQGTNFVTMDINRATKFNDTEELRAWFKRNFEFEVEFIPVG